MSTWTKRSTSSPEHPQPAELIEPPRPERGYTRGAPVDRGRLPTYVMVSTGEESNLVGTPEWSRELMRDGTVCHNWGHNKPGGDLARGR